MVPDETDARARAILRGNDHGGYTVPTEGLYPYQWNWDSAFAAWGFSTFDIPRAWLELETLFQGQWDNGMVPHIVFHKDIDGYFPGPEVWQVRHDPPTSGISQPPVAATMARAILAADPEAGRAPMARLYGKLLAWHRWFAKYRLEEGMIAITHPWESGRDNAPDWDAAMARIDTSGVGEYRRRDTEEVDPAMRPRKEDYDRYLAILYFGRDCGWDERAIARGGPFRMADVGMSFIFLRACRDLLHLAREFGTKQEEEEIAGWIAALEKGARQHWNEAAGHFDSRDLRSGAFSGALTSASFLCWYAGIDDARMLEHYLRIMGDVTYGVPSNDPEAPTFSRLRYWRGPVWGIINTLIGIGLEECGHEELAGELRGMTRGLISEHGFYEYFCPQDGASAGGANFTWTAAIWLSWASPHARGRF